MARTGRPRLEPKPTPRELLEGFCCSQVERIERTFHTRYGMDYDGRADRDEGAEKSYLMPQNDDVMVGFEHRSLTGERQRESRTMLRCRFMQTHDLQIRRGYETRTIAAASH